MTIAVGGNRGSGSSKDSGTDSVSPSLNAAVAVGKDLLVAAVRVPPNEDLTRDPDNIFVLTPLACVNPPSFSDDQGNSYTDLGSFFYTHPNGDGGANTPESGDVICSLHIAKARITTALTTSDHFKVDWGVNGGARAVAACEVTVDAGKQLHLLKGGIGQYHGLENDTTPTLQIVGLPTGPQALLLAMLGIAGPSGDGYTVDSSFTSISAPGTTGGADASNATLRWARRITTIYSDSFDPTLGTARHGLGAVIAFDEV